MLLESDPPSTGSVDERQRRLLTMLAWDLGSGRGRTRRSMITTSLSGSRRHPVKSWLSCSSCSMRSRPPAAVRRRWRPRCRWFFTPDTPEATSSQRFGSATASSRHRRGKDSRRHPTGGTTRSSLTFRRRSATTRRRRCTGTTRSTASCSTGSRSQPRLPSSPGSGGGSSISSEAAASCCSSETRSALSWVPSRSRSSAR